MSAILLVEDHDDSREAMAQILALLGHRVLLARNGVEALSTLTTMIPDLIFCDLRMPGMDGFGFMAALRQDTRLQEVKVVALSGSGDRDGALLRRIADAGFAGHLLKPLDYGRFQATLDQLLEPERDPPTAGSAGR